MIRPPYRALRAAFAWLHRLANVPDSAGRRALAALPASPLGFAVTRHVPPRAPGRGQGAPRAPA